MTNQEFDQLCTDIKNGRLINAAQAADIVRTIDTDRLFRAADDVRRHFVGNRFRSCSIINAKSGRCSEDCKWCSQSHRHHTGIDEYPIVPTAEAVATAVNNSTKGVQRLSLVTSGRTLTDKQLDQIIDIYRAIGAATKIKFCASMGLLTLPQLERLAQAGVDRYHCNIESAPSFFPTLCTTHTTADKMQTICWARQAGMSVCSGGIIGMGETMEQRIEMALFLRDAGVKSIPINVLIPIKGTPLENQPPMPPAEILATFAIFRLICPDAHIRMAGGRAAYKAQTHSALHCGINAAIVGDMLTTAGATTIADDMKTFAQNGFEI